MQETRDPAIRLFGQKIPLPGDSDPPSLSPPAIDVDKTEEEEGGDGGGQESQEEEYQTDEDPEAEGVTEGEQEADPPPNAEEAKNSAIVNPETPSIEEEEEEEEEATKSKSDDKSEKEQQEQPQEKTLKKPEKVLPCPRCNSMDTKFCYYNNYNINQPRYFCKACQRYWTAGGTMRNVPVGAGRRKNKNSASHYHHITISEALQAAIIDAPPNGTQTHLPPTLKSNGTVLSFGLDAHAPICDSMASVLNLGEKKKALNGTRNGYHHGLEDQRLKKNGDDHCSSGASSNITVSSSMPQPVLQNNGFLPQLPPCIPPPLPSVPWPYTWNSPIPPHALCPSGFPPMPFYPPPAFWNVPWYPSHSPKSPSSGPNSPTLGKHSRDGDMIKQEDPLHKEEEAAAAPKQRNGCVLVPKTLRIDDPNEAAKSSIWATLGIKNESVSGRGGSMFKAFQSKKEEKNHVEASPVLMANPAALSRSFNFHENS